MVTLVIPSRNNLKYLQSAYNSIRKRLPSNVELILLDDASDDGTWEWMQKTQASDKNIKTYQNRGPSRIGHTVLYDIGANMASNEIFGIFHADMITSPNYIQNTVKHLKPKTVVCGTRIEPPLHPPGPEKIVLDLGLEPENFQENVFLDVVSIQEKSNKDTATKGIFAPWIMYVKDFKSIGGHDKRVFAPMELEDSDLFNRFLLAGFELIQSRDAFVYHMTCRGSRFKDGIKIIEEIPIAQKDVWKRAQDSSEYTNLRQNKFREWWRKWHSDVLHDENLFPIVYPRYDIGFVIKNCTSSFLNYIEPWADTVYIENNSLIDAYISQEQPHTKFDLTKRVKNIEETKLNDIIIEFDALKFNSFHVNFIKQLPLMIADSGEVGEMEYDIFLLKIKTIKRLEQLFIHADNEWYLKKLKIIWQ